MRDSVLGVHDQEVDIVGMGPFVRRRDRAAVARVFGMIGGKEDGGARLFVFHTKLHRNAITDERWFLGIDHTASPDASANRPQTQRALRRRQRESASTNFYVGPSLLPVQAGVLDRRRLPHS